MLVNNPIIRGFYPDPSICKANGKYYMVCSSFQFFPGVPIFESDNLVHWKQIGHCFTRNSQVNLHKINSSGGVFAPTIRFHEGTFYMVTTNDTYHKNFYVSTTDIYGEWSEPIFVDQGGIDPSLFFENGKAYFMSNGSDDDGKGCIFQCEIDIKTGERLTDSRPIWKGSGGRYLESPHLYRFGEWYYLMAAEGGTEYGHMITYARGTTPYGPFTPYENNPVVTNRNLGGHQSVIQGIGHADLVEDEYGNTFMVCLGFRQAGMWVPYHHLGREVFLVPVKWRDDGWFEAGINGTVEQVMEMDIKTTSAQSAMNYNVSSSTLGDNELRWVYLRDPKKENYEFIEDGIRLKGTTVSINDRDTPTFIGIRQSEFYTNLKVNINSNAKEAGATFYMDENHHYDLAVTNENNERKVMLRLCIGDINAIVNQTRIISEDDSIVLKIVSDPINYYFYCLVGNEEIFLGSAQAKYLSSEVAGGFTGVVMAMYAVSSKEDSKEYAEFTKLNWDQKENQ
ncbi:MAG: Beta-xylosidase [Anaerocolumna sp.]|jgi:alpha-N-arabinofuranosidase|nr:Beta-xylosidase [Anaerocolumna sp.]